MRNPRIGLPHRLELVAHWAVRLDDLSGILCGTGRISSTSVGTANRPERSSCSIAKALPDGAAKRVASLLGVLKGQSPGC